jgi:hypothetical protein
VRAELYATGRGLDQLVEPWIGSDGQLHPGIAGLCEAHDVGVLACDPSEPSLMGQLERLLLEHRRVHGSECRLRARVKAEMMDENADWENLAKRAGNPENVLLLGFKKIKRCMETWLNLAWVQGL